MTTKKHDMEAMKKRLEEANARLIRSADGTVVTQSQVETLAREAAETRMLADRWKRQYMDTADALFKTEIANRGLHQRVAQLVEENERLLRLNETFAGRVERLVPPDADRVKE